MVPRSARAEDGSRHCQSPQWKAFRWLLTNSVCDSEQRVDGSHEQTSARAALSPLNTILPQPTVSFIYYLLNSGQPGEAYSEDPALMSSRSAIVGGKRPNGEPGPDEWIVVMVVRPLGIITTLFPQTYEGPASQLCAQISRWRLVLLGT